MKSNILCDEAELEERISEAEEAELRVRTMLDTIPMGSFLIDGDVIVSCNEAAVKMAKLKSKQDMIDNYFDIIPEFQPDGRLSKDVVYEARRKALEEGSTNYDFHYVLRDGEDVFVNTTVCRVVWGDGYRLATYSRDLKEELEQKERVREAEEHTRVMLNATPLACILMNKELKSIDCNTTALKIWEMDSKEDLLNNYHDVFPETQPDGYNSIKRVYEMRKTALETGIVEYPFTFKLRSGEIMPVEVRVERVEWRGEPMLVGYVRDMRVEYETTKKMDEARNLTQAVLDGVPIGCFIFNDKNEIDACNEEAIKLYGGKDEEDVIKNVFTRNMPEFQPDGRETVKSCLEMIAHTMKTGEVLNFKWMAKSFEGEELPTECTIKRISWGDGAYRIVVYVRDMRVEAQTAKRIDEARNLTQAVLDGVPIGCFIFNDKNEIDACNEEAIKLYGGKDEEDVIKNVFTRNMPEFQPDGRETVKSCLEMIAHTLRTGEVLNFEWMARTHDGFDLPTECTIKRISWGDGAYRMVVYVRDMRTEAETTRKMEEARNLTQAVLDGVPIGCFIFNDKNEIDACNEEAIKLYGGKDEEDVIKNVFTRNMPKFQPDGRETVKTCLEMIAHTMKTGEVINFEWMAKSFEGEELPTECTIKRISWGDGAYRIVVYVRDLRELKRSMAEIERQQAELVEARDLAEASLESKSVFLANMSHEIRTPITAIIGMTDIAKKSDDSTRIDYCLSKISDASEHLLGIINDILDFSKIEAGRFKLSPTDFSLERTIARIADIMAFRIDQKKQNFEIIMDSNVPHSIISDQQRLTQVIMNLLSNAHKFTPDHGKIELNIGLSDDSPKDMLSYKLRFKVIDNGIGIAEEQKNRLFDSFEQGDNNISRRYGGTGLGLAISKAIVNEMGGDIWIESTLGEGSTFTFEIETRRGITSSISRLDPRIDISSVKIMVVDDAINTLEYFASVTESLGLICETASSADECMRKLKKTPADIVFVDWLMPEIDGVELTRQIRRKYGNNIVVIMISAMQWEEISKPATEAGVNRFIAKPLLPSSIIDCINECLGSSSAHMKKTNTRGTQLNIEGKRILLAEDVSVNREIIAAMLENTGVSITYAENGLEACNIFAAAPSEYDLILMDIQMPLVDGYTATRRIREMNIIAAQTVPIIAMTANVFKEDVENCLAAGMNDHIGKPINYDEMIEKLSNHLLKEA